MVCGLAVQSSGFCFLLSAGRDAAAGGNRGSARPVSWIRPGNPLAIGVAAIAMSGARGQDRGSTVLLAFAVAAALFLVLQLADFGYGRDQGIYATVARTLQTGGAPYRDAWDFKPPGIFFVYALAQRLFGMDVSAIRYVEALALCSLLPAAWILAKRYTGDGRAGILSTALAILIHVQSEFWDTAQPESFGAVCVVWALAVASGPLEDSRPERRRWGAWAVAGALYAAATVLKPTVGIAGIASLALAGLETRDSGGGSFGRIGGIVSAMAGGAAVVIGLTLARFLLVGGFSDLVSALFVFAPQYTLVSAGTLGQSLARVLFEWFFWYSPANLVGLLLLALPNIKSIGYGDAKVEFSADPLPATSREATAVAAPESFSTPLLSAALLSKPLIDDSKAATPPLEPSLK